MKGGDRMVLGFGDDYGDALKRKLVRPTFQGAHLGRVGLQSMGDLRDNGFYFIIPHSH